MVNLKASMIALAITPFTGVAGQAVPHESGELYRSAYETAQKDGVITEDEREMLTTLRTTLGLSAQDARAIEELFQSTRARLPDQSGRWPLVAQNMLYAASIYGWMIPYVLDTKDFKWYVGSEMMSLGVSYYVTYRVTKNMEISHARAQMMRAGSAVGLAYARGVNTVLELDAERGKVWAWIVMASVPAGTYVGDKVYARWHPSHGQAWSLSLWAELGAYTLGQLHHLIQKEPEEPGGAGLWHEDSPEQQDYEEKHNAWEKPHVLFSMAGYPLGTVIGHRLFGTRHYTFGDAMMLFQGRWAGWIYGMLTADALDLDMDDDAGRILRTVGSVGGTVLFDRLVRGYDYSFGEAALTVLGTASGAAFALGVSIVSEIREGRVVDILVMTGGAAGFYLSRSILTPKVERQTGSRAGKPAFSLVPGFIPQGNRLAPGVYLSCQF